jgi:hypothetical protein
MPEMKGITFHRLTLVVLLIFISISACNGQSGISGAAKSPDKGFLGMSFGKNRNSRVKAPKSAARVQKEQAKKKKKADEDYAKSVKESQKRTLKIQSPAVQERMKQNQKEIVSREKEKKKKGSTLAKPAKRKYKR